MYIGKVYIVIYHSLILTHTQKREGKQVRVYRKGTYRHILHFDYDAHAEVRGLADARTVEKARENTGGNNQ